MDVTMVLLCMMSSTVKDASSGITGHGAAGREREQLRERHQADAEQQRGDHHLGEREARLVSEA